MLLLLLPACRRECCSLGKMSPVREHSKTCRCKLKLCKQLFVSCRVARVSWFCHCEGARGAFSQKMLNQPAQLQGISEFLVLSF